MNGLMSKASDFGMGILDKVLNIPDKLTGNIQNKNLKNTVNKILKIVLCILIIGAGVVAWKLMGGAGPWQGLMSMSIAGGIGALGLMMLIRVLVPEKYHNIVKKILAFVIPIVLAVGATLLIHGSFMHGIEAGLVDPHMWVGVAAAAMTFWMFSNACGSCKQSKRTVIVRG